MLKSEDFNSLSPLAVKVLVLLLSRWETRHPDEPVPYSITELRKKCPSRTKHGKLTSRNRITKAIMELVVSGYVHKVKRDRQTNLYYIEQKRFTGEYV